MDRQTTPRWEKLGTAAMLSALCIICALIAIVLDHPPSPVPVGDSRSLFSAEKAVKHLASISRAPHPVDSAEHDSVRNYILNTLREGGLAPEVQKVTSINERTRVPVTVENILCRIRGSGPGKAVLWVAHYDSVAAGPGASDDGAAVAAFLEVARILKSLPPLQRDVILLFSDGEETGLLGARAFVAEHPWARDVGFVLNFEARGTDGPSIMFETSDQNGWLIRNFAEAASHPVANSLSYEIYKRLPNNTDFTIFRRAGYSGLNFAFIDGVARYHTSQDSVENLDLGSLQHHGDYLVEMTRKLGDSPSDDPRTPSVVYFDVLGRVLVRYSSGWAGFLLALASTLVALTLYLGLREQSLKLWPLVAGAIFAVAGILIVTVAASAVSTIALKIPAIRAGVVSHPGWYVSVFSMIGILCGARFYLALVRRAGPENLAAGCLVAWAAMTMAVNLLLPGASFMFLWPLMFGAAGWAAAFTLGRRGAGVRKILPFILSLPAIFLIVPMAHKIFFAFAGFSTPIVSLILGLNVSLLAGPIASNLPERWLRRKDAGRGSVVSAGKAGAAAGIVAFFAAF